MKPFFSLLLMYAGLTQANAAEVAGTKAEALFSQLKRMEFRAVVRAGATTVHAMNLSCERNPLAYRTDVCRGYDMQAVTDLRENLEVAQDPAWALYNAMQATGAFKKGKPRFNGSRLEARDVKCTYAVGSPKAARNAYRCTIK